MKSIPFYNKNAREYIDQTNQLDMTLCYEKFEKFIKEGHILDLGCGSGRDSLYFLSKGYKITSTDGSLEMVKHCKSILDSQVIHAMIEDYNTLERYDGIWASASLLHIKREEMISVIQKYTTYLKPSGIFYISFKSFNQDFEFNGRYFTCYTINSIYEVLNDLEHVEILEVTSSESVQKDNMTWLNILLRKN